MFFVERPTHCVPGKYKHHISSDDDLLCNGTHTSSKMIPCLGRSATRPALRTSGWRRDGSSTSVCTAGGTTASPWVGTRASNEGSRRFHNERLYWVTWLKIFTNAFTCKTLTGKLALTYSDSARRRFQPGEGLSM